MAKLIALVAASLLMMSFTSSVDAKNAILVKLTTNQVATVCGKQLQSNPGKASGCSKPCGRYSCDYNCTKDGCFGQCTNCPGTGRVIFPGLKSWFVIKRAVNSAQ
jgi:hypothetical protein